LHTLSESDRAAHLTAMQSKGIKVLRIFISSVGAGDKGSSSSGVNDLEQKAVGSYDDTVLTKIDTLMFEASQKGIKLDIMMHDRYSLGCWAADAYVSKYNIKSTAPNCDVSVNQPRVFYTDNNAQADFDKRIVHILTHKNPNFGNRSWGEISEAVFAFAPENEAQGHMNNPDWEWACRRAATMKKYISNGVLINTGGGVDFSSSLVDNHFQCENISVISIHSYDGNPADFTSTLSAAKTKAISKGKRLVVEEFGATGSDSAKAAAISKIIDAISGVGVPFLPWEFLRPSSSDYEFYTDGQTWSDVGCRAQEALAKTGAFSWPEISAVGANADACGSTTGSTSGSKLPDWDFCTVSAQCADNCCSKQYSSDGKYKCTPNGTQCI